MTSHDKQLNTRMTLAITACSALLGFSQAHAITAYVVPAGEGGNQTFGGSLGMNFDVGDEPIVVHSLGVFDSNGDGIANMINVAIFDRDTRMQVTPILEFRGLSGTLIGSSRFLTLDEPVILAANGNYTIVSSRYGGCAFRSK